MKPTKEQIESYKEMAKTSPDSMKATHWMPLPEPPEGVKC